MDASTQRSELQKDDQQGSSQATLLAPGCQNPSAPRIRRVHTRVALTRSLVSVAWLMVGLKK